jgi:hypothetical protein
MTGRELIAALQTLPASALDLPVLVEGCDCARFAIGVRLRTSADPRDEPDVMIESADELATAPIR